jgi:hypothetical protein
MPALDLTPEQRREIARKKATCPFMGSVVLSGALPVHGSIGRPLAAVQDVVDLGDGGGGGLGSLALRAFAIGNHSRIPDASGNFGEPAPEGFFSLDFPGSKGAHPGDSRILLADPNRFESGRLSSEEFARLAGMADDRGMLTIEAVGTFIAGNVQRDPRGRRLEWKRVLPRLFKVIGAAPEGLLSLISGSRAAKRGHVEFLEELTALAPEDNLIGSAGEFGLLFALLANRPGAENDDEIPVAAVEAMFLRYELPEGWQDWPKRTRDWVEATGELVLAALRATRRNEADG